MIRKELTELLNTILGLNISSIGANTLERSINRRLKDLKLANQGEYISYLHQNGSEINLLIDEVVISETWFFRDTEPFHALREIAEQWYQKEHQGKFRILSIPCASGEEPYSIAITMLEAGWGKDAFRLDAVDVSAKLIERARRATYTRNSFRCEDLSFRDKYFTQKGKSYLLKKEIVDTVNFRCGNLLDPSFMEGLGRYNIIFCRNILIYLEQEAQKRTIRELAKLLQPAGVLFVGGAESNLYLSEGFVLHDHRFGFALVRSHPQLPPAADPAAEFKPERPREGPNTDCMVETEEAHETSQIQMDQEAGPMLLAARQFADNGNLAEAEKICRNILKSHGPIADAYYLLGIINDISGNLTESVKLLKKALYLVPDHEESLLLLSFISERLGDKKSVANYKRRLDRLGKKKTAQTDIVKC